jgi:hypothetical protein
VKHNGANDSFSVTPQKTNTSYNADRKGVAQDQPLTTIPQYTTIKKSVLLLRDSYATASVSRTLITQCNCGWRQCDDLDYRPITLPMNASARLIDAGLQK